MICDGVELSQLSHVTLQLHHRSLNCTKIIQPEEASQMRCDTVAIKKKKKKQLTRINGSQLAKMKKSIPDMFLP